MNSQPALNDSVYDNRANRMFASRKLLWEKIKQDFFVRLMMLFFSPQLQLYSSIASHKIIGKIVNYLTREKNAMEIYPLECENLNDDRPFQSLSHSHMLMMLLLLSLVLEVRPCLLDTQRKRVHLYIPSIQQHPLNCFLEMRRNFRGKKTIIYMHLIANVVVIEIFVICIENATHQQIGFMNVLYIVSYMNNCRCSMQNRFNFCDAN